MPQPAPDWISFDADKTEGLDLLGLRAPVQAIGNDLFNGVTTVTPKLRYLSVIAWIIWRYSQARLPDAWTPFERFASAQEAVIVMANKLAYLGVALTNNARPQPDPRRVAVFEDVASLGMKMLHAPLIGAEKFIHNMPWADDLIYSTHDRQERFGTFAQLYPRHEPLEAYGENLRKVQASEGSRKGFSPPGSANWRSALKKAWDDANEAGKKALRRDLGRMISDWCDVLILASHYAYGNDIFCTADEGKGSGSQSALHHLNRSKLKSQGIDILGPNELLAQLRSQKGA